MALAGVGEIGIGQQKNITTGISFKYQSKDGIIKFCAY